MSKTKGGGHLNPGGGPGLKNQSGINLGSIRDAIRDQSGTQIEKSIWDQSGRGGDPD